jgi:hypothetical protein
VAGVVLSCGRHGIIVWQAWYSRVADVVFSCCRRGACGGRDIPEWQVLCSRVTDAVLVLQAWQWLVAGVVLSCGRRGPLVWQVNHSRVACAPGVVVPFCRRPILVRQARSSRAADVVFSCGRRLISW